LALNPLGGNVGIGTTSPAELLNLSASGQDTNLLVDAANQSTYSPVLTFRRLSTQVWNVGMDDTDSNKFKIAAGGSYNNMATTADDFLTITGGGNVGIGITNPTYALQVSGTVYASGSSRDYKEKIKPLEVDSSKIYNLKPVSYDYKNNYKDMGYNLAGGRQFGLIAEDVYPIIPELVISLGDKKTANIDYSKLSVLLLDQMQKQKKEIDSLQQQVNSLQNEIDLIQKSLKTSR
jgi:hypothetical protein